MTAPDSHSEDDTPLTGRYVAVIVLEIVIIALLYALGRFYA
jgi:hypothetical protein